MSNSSNMRRCAPYADSHVDSIRLPVRIEDAHFETVGRTASECRADPAEPDNAQGLAMHVRPEVLVAHCARPSAGTCPVRKLDHAARACEQQGEHQVGRGLSDVIRRVREHDPAAGQIVDIERVVAGRDG